MDSGFIQALLRGNNNPPEGKIVFDSSDHIRFQNGIDVSGHNMGCNRRIVIEKNINGGEGYTVSMYNLDGQHPLWQNNMQMAPKQMKIVDINNGIIELQGYGYDVNALKMGVPSSAASFANYGIMLMMQNGVIVRTQLNMFDRNINIVYLP